ncbi:MAG TPA: Ig-like domain-containing protein [Gemmatimonadales bacterium]|jgi:hypothetical protein
MKTLLSSLRLIVVVTVFACGESSGPDGRVASVRITPGADTLGALGQERRYSAQALNAGGDPIPDKTFTWSAADPSVVAITAHGVVRALANGATRVRASVAGVAGEAVVVVAQRAATVTMSRATRSFAAVGDTGRFVAIARDANGNAIGAARFLWASADHGIVVVDSGGLAHARGNGGPERVVQ